MLSYKVPPQALRWLAAQLRPHRGALLVMGAGGLVTALFAASAPVVSGFAFDAVLRDSGNGTALAFGALGLLASQLLRAVVYYLRQRTSIGAATRLEYEVRAELIDRVLHEQDPRESDGLVTRMVSDVRALRAAVYPGLDTALASLGFIVVAIALAPFYSSALVLAPALFAVGYVVVSTRQLAALSGAAKEVRDDAAALSTLVTEALDNIEAVRDADLPEPVWRRLEDAMTAHHDASVQQGRAERKAPLILLLGVTQGVGFVHALALARGGQISTGEMVGYIGVLMMLGGPAFSGTMAFAAIANGLAAAARIVTLAAPAGPASGREEPPTGVPRIEVRDAGFELWPRGPEVSGIDLTLPPCSLTVITGPTGSGKSTLARALAGLHPLNGGDVLADGTRLGEWHGAALARCVAFVGEQGSLFSLSLADNIRLGSLDADAEQVGAAARRAGVADIIETLPQGYHTVLGEQGADLSGGQRQRVALARALLSPVPVLVLDDPFSALDAANAKHLAKEVIEVARDRTVVVVSDRRDLIAAADHVLDVTRYRADMR